MRVTVLELKCIKSRLSRLRKIADAVHRLDVCECNKGLRPIQLDRRWNLLKDAQEIAEELGLAVYHQPDPRGGTLWLIDPEDEPQADRLYTNGVNV